jgi:gluconokinase
VIIVVMGAAGAGKSTVGRALAQELQWRFIDADDLHTPENIAKMRRGLALTHQDRMPWLSAVREQMEQSQRRGESAVVACSALTNEYRALLRADIDTVHIVFLKADPALLVERLQHRRGHFVGAALLPSQLATLEDPGNSALTLDASLAPEILTASIRAALHL